MKEDVRSYLIRFEAQELFAQRQDKEGKFDEVLYAVSKLKNGKASGPDNISAEMLKSHNGIAEWLWDIVNKRWTEENLPQDWKLAEVVPLYKNKGKRSECGNYRRSSLLSVPGKVFASIILNRCKDALDQVLREKQCGFQKNSGCSDQLFALKQILEKCIAFQLHISFICFIDCCSAFDLVEREMMCKITKHYGLPQKVVNVVCNSYKGFKCCVKAEGEKNQMFDVKAGVRQGDVWSPILFGPVINHVLANSIQGESTSAVVLLILTSPIMLRYWAFLIPKLKQVYILLSF